MSDCCPDDGGTCESPTDDWICIEADAQLIAAIGDEAAKRDLSIGEFFEYCCEQYEKST